jgi:hypothetical protein
MAWNELDLLKFRIDKIRFSSIATDMQKNSCVVVPPALVRKLLAELGCHVPEGEDPDIFFVVREDEYEELKSAAAANSRARESAEPHAVLLLGCSPSVALTEEMARHRFEVAARNHNEN